MVDAAVLLEDLAWPEAEAALRPDAVVVLPLGAAAKEHGAHLRLNNDWVLAEYLKRRVLAAAGDGVVVAPTLGYHHEPPFAAYPGSVSLRREVARDLTVDVARSLTRHGPRRCYVLNTGVSTLLPLEEAAGILEREGTLLRYSDLLRLLAPSEEDLAEQEGGAHADEVATSMMLYVAPERVDVARARGDRQRGAAGSPPRKPGRGGKLSPSGPWGDPSQASRAKGERFVEAVVEGVLAEIAALARAPLPGP